MNIFFKRSFFVVLSMLWLALLSNNALAASKVEKLFAPEIVDREKPLRDPAPGHVFTFSKEDIERYNSIHTPPTTPPKTPKSINQQPGSLNSIKNLHEITATRIVFSRFSV